MLFWWQIALGSALLFLALRVSWHGSDTRRAGILHAIMTQSFFKAA